MGGIPARDARPGSRHRKMRTAYLNLKKIKKLKNSQNKEKFRPAAVRTVALNMKKTKKYRYEKKNTKKQSQATRR